jgi:hypothetical protein
LSVPDWWEAVLLSLAAWRVFQLLSEDEILDIPRRYVTRKIPPYWADFILCVYCIGFWIVLAWWAAWEVWPHGTLVVATPFALSAGVIGAFKVLASE